MTNIELCFKRIGVLDAARRALTARKDAALAAIHPDDRDDANYSAHVNANDTGPAKNANSFAWQEAYVGTLEMIANCASEYGLRRVDDAARLEAQIAREQEMEAEWHAEQARQERAEWEAEDARLRAEEEARRPRRDPRCTCSDWQLQAVGCDCVVAHEAWADLQAPRPARAAHEARELAGIDAWLIAVTALQDAARLEGIQLELTLDDRQGDLDLDLYI